MGMCIYTRGGVVDPLSEEKRVRREEEVGPFRDVACTPWRAGGIVAAREEKRVFEKFFQKLDRKSVV